MRYAAAARVRPERVRRAHLVSKAPCGFTRDPTVASRMP